MTAQIMKRVLFWVYIGILSYWVVIRIDVETPTYSFSKDHFTYFPTYIEKETPK